MGKIIKICRKKKKVEQSGINEVDWEGMKKKERKERRARKKKEGKEKRNEGSGKK